MKYEEIVGDSLKKWAAKSDYDASSPEEVLERFLSALLHHEFAKQSILTIETNSLIPTEASVSNTTLFFASVPSSNQTFNLSTFAEQQRAEAKAEIRSAVRPIPEELLKDAELDEWFLCTFYFERRGPFRKVIISVVAAERLTNAAIRESMYAILEGHLAMLEIKLQMVNMTANYPKRLAFHSSVLSIDLLEIDAALCKTADAWRNVSGCAWVWLWIYNTDSYQWEFLSCDEKARQNYLPAIVSHHLSTGITAYAWHHQRPILNINPATWKKKVGDQTYESIIKKHLKDLGCVLLDCIPCVQSSDSPSIDIRVAVCLHYIDEKTKIFQPIDPLTILGRITNNVICNLFETQRRRLAEELNHIAAKVLASGHYKPLPAIEEYCAQVIVLLKKHVRIQRASIFYRRWNEDKIGCVASTGLYASDGTKVLPKDYSQHTYEKGERLTGSVYLTGVPYVTSISPREISHKPKCTEIAPEESEENCAFAIYPITLPTNDKTSTSINGVLRCVNPISTLHDLSETPKNFDSFQLKALAVIGSYIGVALEILLAFKEREKGISTTKHDLISPLQGIRDLIERIPQPLPTNNRSARITEMVGDISTNIRGIVTRLELASSRNSGLASHMEDMLGNLGQLAGQVVDDDSSVDHTYRSVTEFSDQLLLRIDTSVLKPHAKRGLRRQVKEFQKLLSVLAQELITNRYGRKQSLCVIPIHDVDNLRDNSVKARAMLTLMDLHPTNPREFKPVLTYLAGDIIARLVNSLERWASEINGVIIKFDFDQFKEVMPALFLDRDDIDRVVSNLLINAIKYSYRNKVVRILVRQTPQSYIVDFVNEGIEILPEEKELVFSEGFRSSRAALHANGDGFGLKIAKQLMAAHGGDVVITSGRNPTVVSLIFPNYLKHMKPTNEKNL